MHNETDFSLHPLRSLRPPASRLPPDETDVNLRTYFSRMSDERLAEYDSRWSDEEVKFWDGNFRCDGPLFLVCCEREVFIDEYRQVIEECRRLREANAPIE